MKHSETSQNLLKAAGVVRSSARRQDSVMANDSLPSAVEAWQNFCGRLSAIGTAVLGDPMVTSARDEAEGLRCLSRQATFALQHAVEFRDPDFPAFQRFDDDVTKWGGPNADNNYLRCAIDPAGTYRLTADITGCREAILSLGQGDMQLGQHRVFSDCSFRDLEIDDNQLEITISPTEHPGNWMPTDPAVRQLSIRVYVVDWENDVIPVFYIERLDRSQQQPEPLTIERAAGALDEAAHWVETSMPFWLRYLEGARSAGLDNVLVSPNAAQGGAADIIYGAGYWNLADDEAWVITFEPPDAFHWSIQTHTWPWFESGDLAHAQTSLNDQQCHIDDDGKARVVVSHVDPGVPNWIDTEQRPIGMVVYRWIWSNDAPTPLGAVTPVADLRNHLPAHHPSVDATARQASLATRRRSVHARFRH